MHTGDASCMTWWLRLLKTTSFTSSAVDDESTDVFRLRESNFSLYRYGGFALHSVLKKRMSHKSSQSKTRLPSANLTVHENKERWAELPIQIQQLQNGGLEIVTPDLLPFLCGEGGITCKWQHATGAGIWNDKVAKKRIEEDKELIVCGNFLMPGLKESKTCRHIL